MSKNYLIIQRNKKLEEEVIEGKLSLALFKLRPNKQNARTNLTSFNKKTSGNPKVLIKI